MRKVVHLTLVTVIVICFAMSVQALASPLEMAFSGQVEGIVEDCSTGAPIKGALVYIPRISVMAKTDDDGKFSLLYVPAGTHELVIEILGQPGINADPIKVRPQEITRLDTICVCPPELTLCNGKCVNLQTDTANCGSCGNVCAAGETCLDGNCMSDAVTCDEHTDCTSVEYCKKDSGDCDGEGICSPMPELCLPIWNPVCGCDGQTYGNACLAAQAGVTVNFDGECPQSELICCASYAICPKCPVSYEWTLPGLCKVPDGLDGVGKQIVEDDFCILPAIAPKTLFDLN